MWRCCRFSWSVADSSTSWHHLSSNHIVISLEKVMKSESKVKYPYGSLESLLATIFPSSCIVELFAGDGGVSFMKFFICGCPFFSRNCKYRCRGDSSLVISLVALGTVSTEKHQKTAKNYSYFKDLLDIIHQWVELWSEPCHNRVHVMQRWDLLYEWWS